MHVGLCRRTLPDQKPVRRNPGAAQAPAADPRGSGAQQTRVFPTDAAIATLLRVSRPAYQVPSSGIKNGSMWLINPDTCINCASCAMACPFGVLRFHQDFTAPPHKAVAVKCDNCEQRQDQGLIPACVEMCKVGALTFEEIDEALKRKTDEVSYSVLEGSELPIGGSAAYALLKKFKKAQSELVSR